MLYVPNWLLVPAIAAVSFVGVYAVHATTFDLVLMVALGIFGWGLRKLGFPMAPLILGFVLGDMMEQNLRRALAISDGHAGILFQSPVSITLWVLAAAALSMPFLLRRLKPAG
jgi:putative tricarboxylic transport membrane protein